jgi:glycosyltransferase involved in cell wall biosynthesis
VGQLPTISVVLPTRDRPELLREAAESVLAQECPPLELLVVEDGARGRASGILHPLDRRGPVAIRLLRGPGRGPGAARNVGLREARGELIAFLDDDDLWLPDKLRRQAIWFAQRPELGLAGALCVGRREPIPLVPRPIGRRDRLRPVTRAALVRANRLVTSSVLVRRPCFDAVGGFDESLTLAQDWDMWLRIAGRCQVGIVLAALTVYRVHGGQRSADRLAMREWEVEVLCRELSRCGARRRGAGLLHRRLAWAHCRLGRLLARRGDTARATEELRRSMALLPYNPMTWCSLLRCLLAHGAPAGAEP